MLKNITPEGHGPIAQLFKKYFNHALLVVCYPTVNFKIMSVVVW